jgi:predicted secreted protein
MRIAVQADDGDEVSITADVVSAEQALVTLQIENSIYDSVAELEEVTLTIDKARELAWALLTTADAVEFVSTPVTKVLSALNYPGGRSTN